MTFQGSSPAPSRIARAIATDLHPGERRSSRAPSQEGRDPLFFGTTGQNRFDDPLCPTAESYGVLYAAADMEGAFIESCPISARAPAVTGVSSMIVKWQVLRCFKPCALSISSLRVVSGKSGRTVGCSQAVTRSRNNGLRRFERIHVSQMAYATPHVTTRPELLTPSSREPPRRFVSQVSDR